MIIIEGPDGAGKTRLIHRLMNVLGLEIAPRFAHPVDGPKKGLGPLVKNDLDKWGTTPVKLYDRHPFISDVVYGPLLRGKTDVSLDKVSTEYRSRFIEQAFFIFALPPLATIQKNVLVEAQMPGVVENITAIHGAYVRLYMDMVALQRSPGVWSYNYKDENESDAFIRLLKAANGYRLTTNLNRGIHG